MTLEERLKRSKSTERVDFSKFPSINKHDPLIKVTSTDRILVEPNWTIPTDFEGRMYADYILIHPEYDGIYVRNQLLSRLDLAARSLSNQYKLVVRAGHRPIEVQKRLLKECAADYKNKHSNATDEQALSHARMYVSDPDISLPPHVCGAAVDVEIFDTNKRRCLDFGSTMNDDNEKSFLYYHDLTEEQKNNRLMLVTAMLSAGLASCMTEWWHYSYGDQLWAWFYGKKYSLYSPIDI